MARTYNHLYEKIYDFENIYRAYLQARRGKRYQDDVMRFTADLECNLINIQNHLIWKTYRTGAYKYFTVREPKERLVAALPFSDRVVHHAICNVIEPIFERSFIPDSYACRVNRGVMAGVKCTTKFLREGRRKWGTVYCLKGDIAKYFQSVDYDALKRIVRKKIACPDTLDILFEIIDSTGEERGMPIGNLTSQLFANVYLNELDHYAKEVLRVKYYIRYMDDFVILSDDKVYLHHILAEIEGFLFDRLRLCLNKKTQIFPVAQRSIDFLGYRIWPDYRLLRKANVKRVKRQFGVLQRLYAENRIGMEEIRPRIMSWLGHAKHADAWRLCERVLGELVFVRNSEFSGQD